MCDTYADIVTYVQVLADITFYVAQ